MIWLKEKVATIYTNQKWWCNDHIFDEKYRI